MFLKRLIANSRTYEAQQYILDRVNAAGQSECQRRALEACESYYPSQCQAPKPTKPLPPLPPLGVPVFLRPSRHH
jgi:hypothetical protein